MAHSYAGSAPHAIIVRPTMYEPLLRFDDTRLQGCVIELWVVEKRQATHEVLSRRKIDHDDGMLEELFQVFVVIHVEPHSEK